MHDTLRAASRRAFTLTLAASLVAALLTGLPAHAAPADDLGAIRHVLMHTFDRPDAPLRVDPIVVHKDQAIADWQQGDAAAMRKVAGRSSSALATACARPACWCRPA
jgi:hypothetical protein